MTQSHLSRVLVSVLGLAILAVVGCGGSSSGTSSSSGGSSSGGSPQLATVDDLPTATGPVESSSSSSLSLASSDAAFLATTGMPLRDTSGDDFDSTTSLAACEMFNMTKASIQNAARGDLSLCYVKNMFPIFLSVSDTEIDIYDGEYHVIAFDDSGLDVGDDENEMDAPDHVKFKIVKNSSGLITGFEMFSCKDGAQVEYINQTISGTDFSMTSKGTHSGNDGSSEYETVVSATLNSENRFIDTKEIVMKFVANFGVDEQWGIMRFNQMSDSATLTGYMNGTFSQGENSHEFTNQVVGSVQLIDPNQEGDEYDIGILALGDGAIGFAMNGDDWSHEDSEAWLGDTRVVTESSDFLDDVQAATLPEETMPTLSFAGAQAYDCGDDAETTIVFADLLNDEGSASENSEQGSTGSDSDDAELTDAEIEEHQEGFQACSNLQMPYDWINCWENSGEGQQEEGDGQQNQEGACTTNADCSNMNPSGHQCFDFGPIGKRCALPCTTNSDCSAIPNNNECKPEGFCGPIQSGPPQ